MLTKQVPAYYAVFTLAAGSLLAILAMSSRTRSTSVLPMAPPAPEATATAPCPGPFSSKRMGGFALTKPLLYSELIQPAPDFVPLQQQLTAVIDRHKAAGDVISASAYVRSFDHGRWTQVNGVENFDPGSMLKIPVMIYWLDKAQQDPGCMGRTFIYQPRTDRGVPNPRFDGPHIEAGRPYTVEELLRYMIVHSDNNATQVLNANMDPDRFMSFFEELGLPRPDMSASRYPMNCRDLSVFLKVLFNSTYLTPASSEKALELLRDSEFNIGLRAGVPENVTMIHKFGESGTLEEKQLHESGIVYLSGHPYLITVMTRGQSDEKLAQVISDLSAETYRWFSSEGATAAR